MDDAVQPEPFVVNERDAQWAARIAALTEEHERTVLMLIKQRDLAIAMLAEFKAQPTAATITKAEASRFLNALILGEALPDSSLDVLRSIVLADKAQPAQEPVAWRYRYSPTGSWNFATEPAAQWASDSSRFEEEPLFVSPQPPADKAPE